MRRVLIKPCGSWPTVILLIIFLTLLLIMIFGGCATYRLERALTPELRAWYEDHRIIMESPLPAGQKITEAKYFLTLPPDLQPKYVAFFWKMRELKAAEVFYSRLAYVQRTRMDRTCAEAARVILINGLPDEYIVLEPGGKRSFGSGPLDSHGWYQCLVVWRYYMPTGEIADYGFEYKNGMWAPESLGVVALSGTVRLERWNLAYFAVTWNGWDEWAASIK